MMPYQLAIQQYINAQPVKSAYLFGSQAREAATQESHVDSLVDLEPEVSLFDFVRMKIQLEERLHVSVDRVSANGLSPYMDQDKKLTYEKTAT